jgi:hypothetical protein
MIEWSDGRASFGIAPKEAFDYVAFYNSWAKRRLTAMGDRQTHAPSFQDNTRGSS